MWSILIHLQHSFVLVNLWSSVTMGILQIPTLLKYEPVTMHKANLSWALSLWLCQPIVVAMDDNFIVVVEFQSLQPQVQWLLISYSNQLH
jgi:hypothetical protein